MKSGVNRAGCVFLFPWLRGEVKRVRISMAGIFVAFISGMLFAMGVVVLAGDYTRLQLLRAKDYLSLHLANRERQNLLLTKRTLETQLEELRSRNSEADDYQEEVRGKLQELASLLQSSVALSTGATSKPSKVSVRNSSSVVAKSEGVGGLERECGSDAQCKLLSEVALRSDSAQFTLATQIAQQNGDLSAVLDQYIELLRVLPIGAPAGGRLSSGYGFRRSPFGGRIKLHEGVDFSSGFGAPVRATAQGVVERVSFNSTYGLHVDVRHSNRMVTRYAHLAKAAVKRGDKVERGTVLGKVGSTGRSTAPHLHYEVLVDGRQRNPASFISLANQLEKIFG